MNKKILKYFLLLVFFFIRENASSNEYNLNQLIDSALQKNYLLKSNEQNIFIKRAEIDVLQKNYLPKINVSANFSYWKFLLPNKQKLLGDALTDMYTDISIYQTVFDWGKNNSQKLIVEEEIKLNDIIKKQINYTIIYGVTDVYFEILKSESEIVSHKNSIQQLESHLQFTENLYKIGKISNVDLLKIRLQISIEEKNLEKAKFSHLSEIIKLNKMCYLNENESINIKDISDTLFKNKINLPLNSNSLYYEIIQNHPSLLASNQRINIESKQRDFFKLETLPEVFSYGIASWEHGYLPFGNNFNYNIGIGINYTIPYLGGSSYKSKMEQSSFLIEQMGYEKTQIFLDLKNEIDLVLNTINYIKKEIINNEIIIDLATETLNNATIIYQAGQGNIIDILDAQTILTDRNIEYRKSILTYLQLLAKLHYLLGRDSYPF